MPSDPSTISPVFFEELVAGKQGLGAEFTFEPNTLEIKPNKLGINGVFARRPLAEGTNILSVPIKNGSLTTLRAYEEAQEFLQKLGSDRYDLNFKFILACAMYLRYANDDTKDSDLLVTEPDLKSSYFGSPTTAFGSKDLTLLISPNNNEVLETASKQEEVINKLGVDPELFRAMLAYVSSRAFDHYGLVPLFDRFNSSYNFGTNCMFFIDENRLTYRLTKDVDAGEELVWCYNKSDALETWLDYGFIDDERPTAAFLEVNLSNEQQVNLESFITNKLTWLNRHELFPPSLVDKCKLSFKLMNVGKQPTPALLRSSIADCLNLYVGVRAIFRLIALSEQQSTRSSDMMAQLMSSSSYNDLSPSFNDEQCNDSISVLDIQSYVPSFGLELERKATTYMLTALKTGLIEAHERADRFKASEVGRSIDMEPFNNIVEDASTAWVEALTAIESICSTRTIEECIPIINSSLNLHIMDKSEIQPVLETVEVERPTLVASLILKYLRGMMNN